MARFLFIFGARGAGIGLLYGFALLLPFFLTMAGAGGLISTLYRNSVSFPYVGASFIVTGKGLGMIRRGRA